VRSRIEVQVERFEGECRRGMQSERIRKESERVVRSDKDPRRGDDDDDAVLHLN